MSHKILIIDDEEDIRSYLTTLLEDHGYEVCVASDGYEGLDVARREKPALITLDLMMPNNSGTDFYRKLSRDKELNVTPIIVVSGVAGRELAVKRPVASFDKPIDPDEFLQEVENALAG